MSNPLPVNTLPALDFRENPGKSLADDFSDHAVLGKVLQTTFRITAVLEKALQTTFRISAVLGKVLQTDDFSDHCRRLVQRITLISRISRCSMNQNIHRRFLTGAIGNQQCPDDDIALTGCSNLGEVRRLRDPDSGGWWDWEVRILRRYPPNSEEYCRQR